MISSARRPSSGVRMRSSSSVSANIRICARGVRSSCETPATKSARRRASSRSRASCRIPMPTRKALTRRSPTTRPGPGPAPCSGPRPVTNAGVIDAVTRRPSAASASRSTAAGCGPGAVSRLANTVVPSRSWTRRSTSARASRPATRSGGKSSVRPSVRDSRGARAAGDMISPICPPRGPRCGSHRTATMRPSPSGSRESRTRPSSASPVAAVTTRAR